MNKNLYIDNQATRDAAKRFIEKNDAEWSDAWVAEHARERELAAERDAAEID